VTEGDGLAVPLSDGFFSIAGMGTVWGMAGAELSGWMGIGASLGALGTGVALGGGAVSAGLGEGGGDCGAGEAPGFGVCA
jgi:hypothetical protein